MPWDVRKNGNWWEIYKPDSNKVVGHSTSKTKAEGSVRARYAGARAGGEKLSETMSMHDIEHACAAVVELNELADAGWKVQSILFNKDAYLKQEKALTKARTMGFAQSTLVEHLAEEKDWKILTEPTEKFCEFKKQKLNDFIVIVHGKLK
jgi:hypothetical protein